MFANKPAMAKEWAAHTLKGEKLPARVKKKKTRRQKNGGLGKLPGGY